MMEMGMGMRMETCLIVRFWFSLAKTKLPQHNASLKTLPHPCAWMTLWGSNPYLHLDPQIIEETTVPECWPLQVGGQPFTTSPTYIAKIKCVMVMVTVTVTVTHSR